MARALADIADTRWKFVGRDGVDLLEPGAAACVIEALRPNVIVNTAAFTDVDGAESSPQDALRLNAEAAGEIARAARSAEAGIIHLSTDYVFDGTEQTPISEDTPTNPLSVYGATKLAGEEAVAAATSEHVIIRTSWIVSPFGRNFLKTMLRLAGDRDEIAVVADQFGRPTPANDLAAALYSIVHRWHAIEKGVYHLAGGGEPTSWAGFAEHIMAARRRVLGSAASIRPIPTKDYPVAAKRPQYSVLDGSKARRRLDVSLPDWKPGVDQIVERVLASTET